MRVQQTPTTPRQQAQAKVNTSRSNLLLMIVLTVVNIVLLAVEADVMLLFSATVPYFLVTLGIVSELTPILIGTLGLTAVILSVYILCWIMSKKYVGWMIAALVMFALDTLALVIIYVLIGDFSGILDAVIHAFVLYYLIIGVKYGWQLKKLPPEEEVDGQAFMMEEEAPMPLYTAGDAAAPRMAEMDVKHRVLLESDWMGHHICYRRVKRINELVIDGYVYDDVEMLIEGAHALNAVIDGHAIQVGFDGAAHSYLRVDGKTMVTKLRLV